MKHLTSTKHCGTALSVLLTLILCFAFFACAGEASAAEIIDSGTEGSHTWTLDSDGVLTIGGTGEMDYSYLPIDESDVKHLVIEEGVTSVADLDLYDLQSVVIPSSVVSIEDYAFDYCESLTDVSIADGVRNIGEDAFAGCTALTGIDLPASVETIGNSAFYECRSMTEATISGGSIGDFAFAYCENLQELTMSEGVTAIGDQAFEECTALTEVAVPEGVESIGEYAFARCDELADVTISGIIIGEYAFSDCKNLKKLTLSEDVTEIDDGAFENCTDLTKVSIPASVREIGDSAFYGCRGLIEAKISGGSIGEEAFAGCSNLQKLTLSEGVTEIEDYAFESCGSLTSVTIPSTVREIGDNAFSLCDSLAKVTISEGVTEIGDYSFNVDSLTEVTIPVSVKVIGDAAFGFGDNLTDVYYGGSEKQWKSIKIYSYNDTLLEATIHYNSVVGKQVKNLKALAFGKKIRLNWDPVKNAAGYYIYAMYSNGDKYKTYSTSNTYANFTGLINGDTYKFKVRPYSLDSKGGRDYGKYSSTVSAAPYNDAVKNLKASAYDQKVKLTWDAVKNAEGYNIYAMYADGSKYKTYDTTKTSCSFTKLTNGNKYQFKIREYKVDSTGTKVYASKYSSAVSATPRMDAVSGFKALPFSQKVNVSWQAMDKADGYYVNVVYSDGTLYKNYSTTKTSVNFTKLTNGKTYKFRVRAYELSSKGSKVYGKYTSYKSVKPYNDKVTGLKAVGGTNKVALSWTAVDKAEGYNIYAMYADGSKYKTYNTTKTACNFNNLKSGKTYQFKVREYKKNAAGSKVYGTYSSVVKATAK